MRFERLWTRSLCTKAMLASLNPLLTLWHISAMAMVAEQRIDDTNCLSLCIKSLFGIYISKRKYFTLVYQLRTHLYVYLARRHCPSLFTSSSPYDICMLMSIKASLCFVPKWIIYHYLCCCNRLAVPSLHHVWMVQVLISLRECAVLKRWVQLPSHGFLISKAALCLTVMIR